MKYKDKIISTLKSGNYLQNRHRLSVKRKGNQFAFCIAGVLCDIHRKVKKGKWEKKYDLGGLEVMSYLDKTHGLPDEVKSYFDVTEDILTVDSENLTKKQKEKCKDCDLISLNDSGVTFEELADLIEKYG